MVDAGDTSCEVKTEFYTREGIWKLVPNCEYIRQLQQQQQQQQHTSPQYQQGANTMNGSSQSLGQATQSSNDPVKIGVFKFSKRSLFNQSERRRSSLRLKCVNCQREQSDDAESDVTRDEEYDDDDDVIFTKAQSVESVVSSEDEYADDDEEICKYCKKFLRKNENNHLANKQNNTLSSSNKLSLDLVVFNFAREIYFYEFNSLRLKVCL